MKKLLTLLALSLTLLSCQKEVDVEIEKPQIYEDSKPYTRWWWFASEIEKPDIAAQLDWLNSQGFGGVEVAFIYPPNRNPEAERIEWLSAEWTEVVSYAKHYADSIGLGCDFTFGTLWPFGGTFVSDYDRTQIWNEPDFKQPLRLSWTHPDTGNVLDHLSERAFNNYAKHMGSALKPALGDYKSAIFCDSWEVESRKIWTHYFGQKFKLKFGYDIEEYMDSIYEQGFEGQLYDYMKLVSEMTINNFYIPFTEKAHSLGAYSRAQCAGAPADLLTAYSVIDIPETEAMLYEPNFSRIVSSSAALSGKNVVTAETFTCLYGWPREHFEEEKMEDLKLICDALFANGTNQIIWHGFPFNPIGSDSLRFYATVHVGKSGTLAPYISDFNRYMTEVSANMKKGKVYSDIAVYLPTEDAWIAGEYPKEKQMPWSWGQYEMRYIHFPEELNGHQPTWINNHFLKQAVYSDGKIHIGDNSFSLLYIDVNYIDFEALKSIYNLAKQGLKICFKEIPKQAGFVKEPEFMKLLTELTLMPNCTYKLEDLYNQKPIIESESIPEFFCRKDLDIYYIFISNPKAWNLTYPLEYGQSEQKEDIIIPITLNIDDMIKEMDLIFKPNESILLKIVEGEALFVKNK